MTKQPPIASDTAIRRAARIAFVFAAIFAFVMAVLPHPPPIPGQPPDAFLHMLAFATLGVLGVYGFRGLTLWRLFAGLTLFGAVIELVQAIPSLNRDSDPLDLLADIAAALVALLVTRWLIAAGVRRAKD